jgi:hypothetical protein
MKWSYQKVPIGILQSNWFQLWRFIGIKGYGCCCNCCITSNIQPSLEWITTTCQRNDFKKERL